MEAGGWKSSRLFLEVYAHSEQAGRNVSDLFDRQAKKAKEEKDE
jgi:hypothetical protein